MTIVLSVIAVLTLTITTGLGVHAVRAPRPKEKTAEDLDAMGIKVWDRSWTWL